MPLNHSQNKSKRQRLDEAGAKLRAVFGKDAERKTQAPQTPAPEILSEAWNVSGQITEFAVKYLGHLMKDQETGVFIPPAKFHRELYQILLSEQYAAIAAPREHAKSTVVTVIFVLYCICLKRRRFIIIIEDTQPNAALQLAAIKEELETNSDLRADFGNLVGDKKWDTNDCRTSTGISLVARGAGQSLRGLRYRLYRPDLVVCDDLENDVDVENPDSRASLERWFKRVVMNLGKKCQIFVIGTILHYDSLLSNLLDPDKYKRFVKRRLEAVDQEWSPESVLWPEKWSIDDLKQKASDIGTTDFNQEFRNLPISADTQVFQEAWIKAHAYTREELRMREIHREQFFKVTYCDPAISQKRKADDFASVTLTIDSKGFLLVTRAEGKKMPFTQQRQFIFDRYDEEHPVVLGIEQQAYQEALKQEIEEKSRETGRYINVIGVNNLTDKFLRISSIASLVENGTIRFCLDGTQQKLISQLLFLGKIKDDLADALQGAVQLARQQTFSAAIAMAPVQIGTRDRSETRSVFDNNQLGGRREPQDFMQRNRRSLWR
jgi:predicted phage terminase large subunit-like protein